MSSLISIIGSFANSVIELVSIIVNFIMFLLFAIRSIFNLIGRVITKIFSLDFWDTFMNMFGDLGPYLGDITYILIAGFVIIFVIMFYKFIIGLFKGRSDHNY